jgi:hypothetical protein
MGKKFLLWAKQCFGEYVGMDFGNGIGKFDAAAAMEIWQLPSKTVPKHQANILAKMAIHSAKKICLNAAFQNHSTCVDAPSLPKRPCSSSLRINNIRMALFFLPILKLHLQMLL